MPELPAGVALAWGEVTPGRRGPKPAFTIDQIVNLALDLADGDGTTGVSMPRLAAELGVTTSALYRYVRDKDELVALMVDAAWASAPTTVRRARTWRSAVSAWATARADRYGERPWLLSVPAYSPWITPNSLQWLEVFLDATSKGGLSAADAANCATLVDAWARTAAALAQEAPDATLDEYIVAHVDADTYPAVSALASARGVRASELGTSTDFALERVLDGIAALADKKKR